MRIALSLAVAVVLVTTPARAQQSAPAPAGKPAAGAASTPGAAAPGDAQAAEPYTYQPAGRRDPFLTLLGSGPEEHTAAPRKRGEGLAGLSQAEISVRGVIESRGSLVAMIAGPDNHTYVVHEGDKLLDATIKTITPQGLVMIQDVKDPLSTLKHREIRKLLRGLEDAKE